MKSPLPAGRLRRYGWPLPGYVGGCPHPCPATVRRDGGRPGVELVRWVRHGHGPAPTPGGATLRIEHPIRDYQVWQAAFDRFSQAREQAGVRGYVIRRPATRAT